MKNKTNNFLKFLQKGRFYNKIYDEVFSFFKNNKEFILNRLHDKVNRVIEIQECELDFKNVWIDSKLDSKIEFDIAISVDLAVIASYGKNHDRDNYYANYIWVTVNCSGDVAKRLDDFEILGVEEFNKTKPKKPLSGDLVPVIRATEYSKYANDILEKYYSEVLKFPMKVDVDKLAKRMSLTVINKSITEDGSLFGQIYFKDTVQRLYNKKTKSMKKYKVPANTILVDKNVAYLYSFGSRNMTVAHECIHYALHKKAFYFAQMIDDDLKYIQCQVNGRLDTSDSQSSTYWMELQANAIAPYILMPENQFKAKVEELYKSYGTFKERDILDFIESIIIDLAEFYEVTVYAARKRMIDLGYEIAIGALNWVDDHYVRPYFFKKGSLASNETFTINYKDIYKKAISGTLAIDVITNRYVFVENHFCINDLKYVAKDLFGDLKLTEYARLHMDECCVKFKYHTIHGFNEGSDFGLMCYLCRDCSKELEFDLEISSNPAKIVCDTNFDVRYRTHKENVEEVMVAIYNKPFKDILKYLMDYLKISIKEFEIDSGVNERTIRRYLNGENKDPNKRTVIAFLRTLNLPYKICEYALKQAGISFVSGNDEDDALISVLSGMRNASARQTNQFMCKLGFESLTNED